MSAELMQAVEQIRKATKGFGTDEKGLIEALVRLPPHILPQLDAYYKANYGKPVDEVLKSEVSGNFGKLLRMLVLDEPVVAARALHTAMKGLGTDTKVLSELLTGRSNYEINAIKAAYKNEFGKDLEKKVRDEVSGHVEKFFVVVLQAMRDETSQFGDVDGDVQVLYKAGEGKIGTDEAEFIRIICNRGYKHLINVFNAYARKHERSITKVIQKEFSGTLETLLLNTVNWIQDYPTYFAEQLESSMAGIGTDEDKLNRLIIRIRRLGIMPQVKEAYLKKYGKSLDKRIKGETSGDYEKLLIALVLLP